MKFMQVLLILSAALLLLSCSDNSFNKDVVGVNVTRLLDAKYSGVFQNPKQEELELNIAPVSTRSPGSAALRQHLEFEAELLFQFGVADVSVFVRTENKRSASAIDRIGSAQAEALDLPLKIDLHVVCSAQIKGNIEELLYLPPIDKKANNYEYPFRDLNADFPAARYFLILDRMEQSVTGVQVSSPAQADALARLLAFGRMRESLDSELIHFCEAIQRSRPDPFQANGSYNSFFPLERIAIESLKMAVPASSPGADPGGEQRKLEERNQTFSRK